MKMLLLLIEKDFGHTSGRSAPGRWADAMKMVSAWLIMTRPMPGLDCEPGPEQP